MLVSYPWWWSQAAAAVNQLTQFVLALPPVSHGIYKLMQYAVGGVALGGWQLIDLFLMGAIGSALLGLIFLKVVIVLLGALLYAIGPLMIALVPTDGGIVIARAWASAALALLMLPLAWSTILAVGALLINDSSTAGPLIAGQGSIASLLGGLLLAFAGLASLWLCIRAAREAGERPARPARRAARPRTALAAAQPPPPRRRPHGEPPNRCGASRGESPARPAQRSARRGRRDRRVTSGARAFATHSRHGLLGAGGAVIRTGALAAAPGTAALVGRTRAGAAAVRMARAGTASWQTSRTPDRTRAAIGRLATDPHRVPPRPAATRPKWTGHRRARRPDADRAARSNATSSGRPVYAARRQAAPRAPHSADSRAQASGRTGSDRAADRIEEARHPAASRSREQSAADRQAGQPARGAAAAAAEGDLMQTLRRLNDPERYYGLSWRGWLGVARRRWAALRRGQGLTARAAPDDHDRRARADVLRRRAARPLGTGSRPRAPPARADPLRTHAQTAHAPRRATTRRSGPRHRSPGRRARRDPRDDIALDPVAR